MLRKAKEDEKYVVEKKKKNLWSLRPELPINARNIFLFLKKFIMMTKFYAFQHLCTEHALPHIAIKPYICFD